MVNVAGGTEWRNEQFTIGAGGPPSWEIGPYAAQGFSSGSNGFNGYRADTTAGSWSRRNVAVYGDVEFNDPGGQWTVGTAVRSENFEDFGTTTNGKLSARVGLTDVVSVRGAVSSGFRAPTPGQQHAFNVTTAFIGGQLTNNGVVPSTSAVAVARGGGQLQPETSINLSTGAVIERGPFLFTADFFRINIHDRVALSQEIALTEPEILTLLAEDIPEARNFPVFRFFLNDFSTTTQEIDLIASLAVGRTTVSAVFNYTDTTVKNIDSAVIDEFRINTLERGLPKTRWNVSLTHRADRWSLVGRLNYFGQYWDSEDGRNAAVGSTDRCNSGRQLISRGGIAERFARSCVEASCDRVEIRLRIARQVSAMGKVLSQQAIGVLVRTSLPGALRVAAVDLDLGGNGKRLVRRQFVTAVPGQRHHEALGQRTNRL